MIQRRRRWGCKVMTKPRYIDMTYLGDRMKLKKKKKIKWKGKKATVDVLRRLHLVREKIYIALRSG